MAATISRVSDASAFFHEIFEDTRYVARETSLMTQLVTPLSATGWMDRTVPIYPELTATSIAEGVDFVDATLWNKTEDDSLTPDEIMVQVLLTDRRIETDPADARRDASYEMGAAISEKIDTDLVTSFADFTADKGPGAGATIAISYVAAGITKLRANKTPAPISIVLHPYQWHRIWTELGQPAANKAFLGDAANRALRDFYVSDLMNVMWYVSANIPVDASEDAVAGMFNRQAMAFDVRKAPLFEYERDASKRAWELNLSAGYAQGVWRDSFGIKLTSDCAEPS
jgi:hypothetical protein